MSLRHAVLGLLTVEPATGYQVTQRFSASLANAWHASHSQVYPELGKLEAAGLVEVVDEGARGSRTYAVTAEGREELRRWLLAPPAGRTQRNETAVRWFLFALLEPADRRAAIEAEIAAVDAQRAMLTAKAEQLDEVAPDHPFRPTVELGLRTTAVMREWLEEQLAKAAAAPSGRRRSSPSS